MRLLPALRLLSLVLPHRPGHLGFMSAERRFWRDDAFGSQVLGFVKSHKRLTHLVVRNAGHMVSTAAFARRAVCGAWCVHAC